MSQRYVVANILVDFGLPRDVAMMIQNENDMIDLCNTIERHTFVRRSDSQWCISFNRCEIGSQPQSDKLSSADGDKYPKRSRCGRLRSTANVPGQTFQRTYQLYVKDFRHLILTLVGESVNEDLPPITVRIKLPPANRGNAVLISAASEDTRVDALHFDTFHEVTFAAFATFAGR